VRTISPPPFLVSIDVNGDQALVQVAGDIDLATAPSLTEALTQLTRHGIRRFTLGLADVGFVDSSGIRCIVRLLLEHPDVHVGLAEARPQVQRAFSLSGLDDHLTYL